MFISSLVLSVAALFIGHAVWRDLLAIRVCLVLLVCVLGLYVARWVWGA